MKSNPLFMDSTKVRHDSVTTQVEVEGLVLYPGEKAFFHIITEQNKKDKVKMLPNENGVYQAKLWLNHQENISYYISIENENRDLLYLSKVRSAVASYMILENWSPCFEKQDLSFKKEKTQRPSGFDFDFDFEFSTQL